MSVCLRLCLCLCCEEKEGRREKCNVSSDTSCQKQDFVEYFYGSLHPFKLDLEVLYDDCTLDVLNLTTRATERLVGPHDVA